jgi:taurine dioxygenase
MNHDLIIKKKVGYFGIEIYNFDINSEEHKGILQELLDDYLVIIIKNTFLSYKEQVKLATIFGEPTLAHPVVVGNEYFPQILEIDGAKGGKNAKWHTDVSFLENPHSVSILTGDEIPDVGGDTLWCDLRTSYEKITNNLKEFLNNCSVCDCEMRNVPPAIGTKAPIKLLLMSAAAVIWVVLD